MSASPQNPDTRSLPPGWISQYDANYRAWFYVNTAAQPPVTTWVHPLGPAPQSPPPPPSYGPPSGPPPPSNPPPSSGYERGPGYGYGNSYGPPGPQGGYGGPPGPYGGPPGPYSGPPGYGGGYGGPSGGPYPQYGGGPYPQEGYGSNNPPADERGRGFGGLFSGRRNSPDRGQRKNNNNLGKVALGVGGAALGAFALKEFIDHKEDEAFDAGRADGYDTGYNQGFDTGFIDGGDGTW